MKLPWKKSKVYGPRLTTANNDYEKEQADKILEEIKNWSALTVQTEMFLKEKFRSREENEKENTDSHDRHSSH